MSKFVTVLARFALMSVVILFVISAVPAGAQEQAEQQKSESATQEEQPTEADPPAEAIPDPQELGPWWLFSALKYEPIYPKWLFHLQGSFTYTKLTGNTEGSIYGGAADFALRKNRYTTHLVYSLSKTDTSSEVEHSTTEDEKQLIFGREQIDLTKRLGITAGTSWERDSTLFLKDRFTHFTGLNVILFDVSKHFLQMAGYYGYDHTQYDNARLTSVGYNTAEDIKSDGVLLSQTYRANFTEQISLTERFGYMAIFDDDDSYRWRLTVTLNANLTKNVSVFANHLLKEEKTPLLETLKPFGAEKRDSETTLGIALHF